VVRSIIGAKTGHATTLASGSPSRPPAASAPSVSRVVIDDGSEGQRLDNFLLRLLKGVPKTHVYRVIRSGEVRVNKGRASADTRLVIGDEVRVPPVRTSASASPISESSSAPAREFPVVYEDEHFLVIDKPAGIAVHGGSGVSFGVIEQLRRARPDARFLELVHRLDKETSGLLLIAKKRSALLALQDQFREHHGEKSIVKTYSALVLGVWPARCKVIDVALHKTIGADGERVVRAVDDDHPDGRRSITLVKVNEAFDAYTLLDVTLKTGRTHQIRVHLTTKGHAIVGDDRYGDFTSNRAFARGEVLAGTRFGRMFLHARRLRLLHPASGESLELEAPLPADCVTLLTALRATSTRTATPKGDL
jgi:23S rRNA pseudouridine955/2504/2580 synthase